MKWFSIDRIEGKYAICEDDDCNAIEIHINDLPRGIKESDIIMRDENGKFTIDLDETQRRRKEAINLKNELTN